MNPLEAIEGLCRAILGVNRGDGDHWRGIARMIAPYVAVVAPFLTPATAAELHDLFSQEIGEGPTDRDPGF